MRGGSVGARMGFQDRDKEEACKSVGRDEGGVRSRGETG